MQYLSKHLFFTELEQKNPTISTKPQSLEILKTILMLRIKMEISWSLVQTIIYSYINQNYMIPEQKKTRMKWNREQPNKPTHIWLIYLWQKKQEYSRKKTGSSITSVWKTGCYIQKNETGPLSETIY